MSVARLAQVCWTAKAWQRAASCGVLGWVSSRSTWSVKDAGVVRVDQAVSSAREGGQVGGGHRPPGGRVFQDLEREAAAVEPAGRVGALGPHPSAPGSPAARRRAAARPSARRGRQGAQPPLVAARVPGADQEQGAAAGRDRLQQAQVGAGVEVVSADLTVGDPNPSKVTYAKNPVVRPNPFAGLLFNGGGRPLNLAAPAPTVLASAGWNRTPWIDTDGILAEYHAHLRGGAPRSGIVQGARRLTVAEVALLQTFPAYLTFAGSRASQYIQVGNAVPPDLAAVVAQALVRSLGTEPIQVAA